MSDLKEYISENKERFLSELFELLRIPSISSQSEHKNDMRRAAELWKKLLLEAGADKAEVMETKGNPVTFAEKAIDKKLPTVLVYGHMDVMPVDPVSLWDTPPFEPVIMDGKIYGRGADDDKGQGFIHAKVFEYLVASGKLNCNIKFLIEGEEEIGSPNLMAFCEENRDLLSCDVILVSDTSVISPEIPSITTGLRGLAYWEVEVTGPNRDLHSGLFGGAVANPINVLCKMIAQMTDGDGRITIPGFYDDVLEVSTEERAKMAEAPFDETAYKKSIGVKALKGETGYSTSERTGIRPSFDVCGIWGGYTGEGAKTVLPSKAYAKVSSRLVPNQDHVKIAVLFKNYFESIAPESVSVKVTPLQGGYGYVCPIDIPAYKAAEKAYESVFGKVPVPVRSGGSIPIISSFEQILGVKSVLMGFGLESDAIHGPNENFPLEQFFKGIETVGKFYEYYKG
ncbi:dipeptidase [Alkalitalea saponilacus]|uniref:Acetylornithine deacetylase/Succinyl-diaminopimelate desuccinylase n=1 Tax=Alkalitalea saponilacus TaxID=889453 RepID=A0A1T5BIA1_9BACT|nr:dipeptidase [Alkalitalea saponilacus]ASB49689.1 peptidase M20 [Alkalitalea saponilacus]SKB46533.1 Acetylornithine deacetylase/Succinyl-diaminopimelate desuccinylase [Alkalitalea saponilacus]